MFTDTVFIVVSLHLNNERHSSACGTGISHLPCSASTPHYAPKATPEVTPQNSTGCSIRGCRSKWESAKIVKFSLFQAEVASARARSTLDPSHCV